MKTCIYFAEIGGFPSGQPGLLLGRGFTKAGFWRNLPLPEGAAGLAVDDLFPPNPRGLTVARQALSAWEGLIVMDFERALHPGLAALVRALAGKRVILPPAYAALPHAAVLVGPWQGGCPLPRWLAARRSRYGALVLDAAPLRCRVLPGRPPEAWKGALPEEGFPCPGLGCLHRRQADGSVLFWDTKQSLRQRLEAAGVPAIVLGSEWRALPDG